MTPKPRVLVALLTLVVATSGCFLKPKKKSDGKKTASTEKLVDRASIFLDRIGDGDAARLTFKTKKATLCELDVYSQDGKTEPTKATPKTHACAADAAGRTEITEKIEGLRTDALYFVVIRAWVPTGKKENAESVIVKEAPSPNAVIDPTQDPVDDGKLKDLLVARFDVPLRAAEVHHHQLTESLDTADIRSRLRRTPGCRAGFNKDILPFRGAAADVAIQNLATKDFATGAAGVHPEAKDRLSLAYGSVNDGVDKWTLLYQLRAKDFMIVARPVVKIQNMEMESTEVQAFEAPQLATSPEALKIDPAKPLKISWTYAGTLPDPSYLVVLIGRAEDATAIQCVFAAEKRTAEIDPKLLQGLEDGKHVLLAELTTHQLWAKEGWLVSMTDWRSGRIEK